MPAAFIHISSRCSFTALWQRQPNNDMSIPPHDPADLRGAANQTPCEVELKCLRDGLALHQIELKSQNEDLVSVQGELEASLLFFTDHYENAPVGYLSLKTDGEIKRLNHMAAGLLGQERSCLMNRRFGLFLVEEDRLVFADCLTGVFMGQKQACEVTLLEDSAEPSRVVRFEAVGSPSGEDCRAVLTDITERRRMEVALRETSQRLKLATDAGGVGIWTWNFSDDTLEWDDRLWDWYDVPAAARQGGVRYDYWRSRIHPDDLARSEVVLLEAHWRDTPYSDEFRVLQSDGSVRHLHAAGVIEHDANGKPLRMIGINRDITERKRAEARQHEIEARFRTMANSAPVLIWLAGVDKGCTFFNETWLNFTGRALKQELGNGWAAGVHPEDLDRCLHIYGVCFEARQEFKIEYRLRRADGVFRWIHDTGVPRFDGGGEFLGYIGSCLDITDQKELEREVGILAAWHKAMTDCSPHAVIATSVDGVIQTFNPAAERMLGYAARDMVGKETPALLHDPREVAERALKFSSELAEKLEPGFESIVAKSRRNLRNEHEWSYIRKDGSRLPVLLSVSPIKIADETVIGFLGVAQDITESNRAEVVLKASEEKYRLLFDNAGDAIFIHDGDGSLLTVNSMAVEKLGYAQTELMTMTAGQLQLLERREETEVGLAGLRMEGDSRFETVMQRKDGSVFPADVKACRTLWEGRPAIMSTCRDISELKLASEKLRKLSQAVEQSESSTLITNLSGVIEYSNPWVTVLTGYTPGEVLGQNPRLFQSGQTKPETYRELWQTILAGKVWRGELHNRKKNGDLHWEDVRISPVLDSSGQITHFLSIKEDVTERKRITEELLETNRSLAAANSRAKALTDEAIAANRSKSEFLAVMSHEIRTPMNAVLGMTRLLLNTRLDARQADFAQTVATSGEALLEIINDILDISKIEAGGEFPLEEQPLSLRNLTGDLMRLLQPRAGDRGLTLGTDLAEDIPDWVKGDAGRLRQVLMNLAGNGLKFTDRGGVAIRVRSLGVEESCVGLRFEVRDTGIGISAEDVARLFQPFSQADSSASRQRGGTGLGLAISKRIVELMGGSMGLESTPGHGSMFWFEITLEVASAPVQELAVAKGAEGVAGAAPTRPLRILVAEDNQLNRRLAGYMLESLGQRADFAITGREAVEAWERSSYDIILMDCQMAEMDGFEATREIRRREAARTGGEGERIRIVALTADAVKGAVERCLAAGMDGYLSKPYTAQELGLVLGRRAAERTGSTLPAVHGRALPVPVSFDPTHPAQLCADLGVESVREIIEDLLKDLARQAVAIESMSAAGRWQELGLLAHSLQGISMTSGLVGFSVELRLLERLALAGDGAEAEQVVRRLPAIMEQGIAALREWLAGL